MAFDDKGYLNLYKENVLLWRSKDSYETYETANRNNSFSFSDALPSAIDSEKNWFLKGRLIAVNTERGQEVIAIKKIQYLSKVPGLGYGKAEVYSFSWNGTMMDETLILSGIKGSVTDYWLEGDNLLVLAQSDVLGFLSKAASGNFKRGSILYYYMLGEK
jgi:hypothetical protein